MDWEDVRPAPKQELAIGGNLDALSIDDLEARIAALKSEIARVEGELETRRRRAAAAQALFND